MAWQPCRAMKGNKANELPENFVFVDTETVPDNPMPDFATADHPHKFRLGVAVGYRRKGADFGAESWLQFTDPDVFWAWLTRWPRKRSPVWVFAHNADYDFQALELTRKVDESWLRLTGGVERLNQSTPNNGRTKRPWQGLFVTDDKPWIIVATCPAGMVTIVDSMNYLSMPLSEIGRALGLCKLSMPEFSAADSEWFTYCRRDVEILSRAMLGIMSNWRSSGCGNWQWTAGRLAMTNFRHIYKGPSILVHGRNDVKKLERSSYFGGEIRNWYRGHYAGPVHSVDVRGSYASTMRDGRFPRRLIYSTIGKDKPCAWKDQWSEQAIAEVTLDTFEDHYPKRVKGRLTWPRGRFGTVLAGAELKYAIDNGAVVSVDNFAVYELFPIFRGYIDHWWAKRRAALESGDPINDQLAKMMMLNLYGKWGAMKPRWGIVDRHPEDPRWGYFLGPDPETGELVKHRAIGGTIQRQGKPGERTDTFVAIASFVTAADRLKNRKVRLQLPPESVLLQQTDGLWLTEDGRRALGELSEVMGNELGDYRDVSVHDWADVCNANWSITSAGAKLAGVPSHRYVDAAGIWSSQRADRLSNQCATGPQNRIRWTVQEIQLSNGSALSSQDSGSWLPIDEVSPIDEYLMESR